ncbi:MAG: DNA polymerase III subunit delta' [Pyrinomonadaceae bacterium]
MFERLVGNQRVKESLRRMLEARRVPGALLFAGEDGVGKKRFALELAKAFNCRARVGVEACGHCPACVRIEEFALPPTDEKDEYKKIIRSAHTDVGMVLPYKRAILVDAIRDLEREANFRPFEGEARIFLIEEADKLNEASSNALLKTLEEPPATSHLILITSRPAALLPTIRSRCQTIRFSPLTVAEIETQLVKDKSVAQTDVPLLARAARGSIGRALSLSADSYRAQREAMLKVLSALVLTVDRVQLLRSAEELNDAKLKDEYEARLDVLETLVRDVWRLALDPKNAQIVNEDLREQLKMMAERTKAQSAARRLMEIEKLREQLAVNINRKVTTDALFLGMASR